MYSYRSLHVKIDLRLGSLCLPVLSNPGIPRFLISCDLQDGRRSTFASCHLNPVPWGKVENRTTTMEYDYLFKLVLIGDPKTGKTAISCRFSHPANREFDPTYISTVGSLCFAVCLRTKTHIIQFTISDTHNIPSLHTISMYAPRSDSFLFAHPHR